MWSSFGQRRRVHRAAAAEGDEREVARVVAAADRDELQGIDHVLVGDADHAERRVLDRHAERVGDLLERSPRQLDVDLDLAAEEVVAG